MLCHWLASATHFNYSHHQYWNVSAGKFNWRLTPGTNHCITHGSKIPSYLLGFSMRGLEPDDAAREQFLARRWSACRCQSRRVCARHSSWEQVSWQRDREWRGGGGGGGMADARQQPCRVVGKYFGGETRTLAAAALVVWHLPPFFFFLVSLSAEFLARRCGVTGQSSRLAWCTARTSHPAHATKTSIPVSSFRSELFSFFFFFAEVGIQHLVLGNVKVTKQNEIRNMVKENEEKRIQGFFFFCWKRGPAGDTLMQTAMRGLVAPIYSSRSEALCHSSDEFPSRCELTVGISNFSNSTSLRGKTSSRKEITKEDWAWEKVQLS